MCASHTFGLGSYGLLCVSACRAENWRHMWWGLLSGLRITLGPSRDPGSPTPPKHLTFPSPHSLSTGNRERGGRERLKRQCAAAPTRHSTAVHLCRISFIQAADRRHYNIHRLPHGLFEDEPPFGGKEDEGLSCHCRLVFSLVLSAAGTRSALGIAVLLYFILWRLLLSAALVVFFRCSFCVSSYPQLQWK